MSAQPPRRPATQYKRNRSAFRAWITYELSLRGCRFSNPNTPPWPEIKEALERLLPERRR